MAEGAETVAQERLSLHSPTDHVLSLSQTLRDVVIGVLHKVKSQLY